MANPLPSEYYVTKVGTVPRLTMETLLLSQMQLSISLLNIVLGIEKPPDVSKDDEETKYTKRANKAVSVIYGSISLAIQVYVSGLTDAIEMWTTLCKTMDIVQNESGSSYMGDKFHHESFAADDTIDLYIGHILSYQERLANTKQNKDNKERSIKQSS
ncbi:hypothetical protein L211DRAFT_848718 [Terfezia boudieri ATCC MYA-4762]|uniref:Uncharacterized protein n=1 Tax=Terfezia boudieri ATCC MYA-4762 TaxID=1051890 RepID=A0A3N4LUR6_9PEZI|nr:hypothetical protein L211DRAFT_848718 [Terfezia boudieri ATCC MYA-4762]